MEDLRADSEILKEVIDKDAQKLYYPSFKVRVVVWFSKNKKKLFKYIAIVLFSTLLLKYPTEIGTFIGDWSYAFYTSITKNFKN